MILSVLEFEFFLILRVCMLTRDNPKKITPRIKIFLEENETVPWINFSGDRHYFLAVLNNFQHTKISRQDIW